MVTVLVRVFLYYAVVTKSRKSPVCCSAHPACPTQVREELSPARVQMDRGYLCWPLWQQRTETRYFDMGFFTASAKKWQLLVLPIFLWSDQVTWSSSVERRIMQLPVGLEGEKDHILANTNNVDICPSAHQMIASPLFPHRKRFSSRPQ